jgi:hypothetical protein
MIVNLPAPTGVFAQPYFSALLQQLTQAFRRCADSSTAASRITLQSPNGQSWDITVSNTGVVTAVANTGHINAAGGHPP